MRAFRRRGGVIKTADEADARHTLDYDYTRALKHLRGPLASRPSLPSEFYATTLRYNLVIHAAIGSETHDDDDGGDGNIKITTNTDYLRE